MKNQQPKLNPLNLCLIIILIVTGCSPARISIEKEDLSRLQGESRIYVVTYRPAQFSMQTTGDLFVTSLAASAAGVLAGAVGGLIVGMQADSQGKTQGQTMVGTYSLEDPAVRIRESFMASAATQFNLSNLVIIQESLANDDLNVLKERFGEAAILDFKTDDWEVLPGPMSLSLYRVMYAVRSRFLRTTDNRILWQGYCRYNGANSRATLDELKANSGALLKTKMEEAADFCARELVAQFSEKE